MTSVRPYSAPLLSTYGSEARSLLYSDHNYKTSLAIIQGRQRLSRGSGSSLNVTTTLESSSSLLHALTNNDTIATNGNDSKRMVGVVKNGMIAGIGINAATASGIQADVTMDSKGAVSGGVVVPRGTWIKGVGFTGGMNLTEHDHWQEPEQLRYIGGTSVGPWWAAGLQVSQVVPSYAHGDDTLPTSSISPAYMTPSLSYTLPRHMPWGRNNDKLAAIQSPISIGTQVKIPIDGSSPSFDSGIQYKRDEDATISCMSTNNMTGARLTYHVPIYDRGPIRGIGASYDIQPRTSNKKNLSTIDIMRGKDATGNVIAMRRALSVGAQFGWNSGVTGKVRLDSDATLSYALKYAVNPKASVGIANQWCLQQKKPIALGLQLELET